MVSSVNSVMLLAGFGLTQLIYVYNAVIALLGLNMLTLPSLSVTYSTIHRLVKPTSVPVRRFESMKNIYRKLRFERSPIFTHGVWAWIISLALQEACMAHGSRLSKGCIDKYLLPAYKQRPEKGKSILHDALQYLQALRPVAIRSRQKPNSFGSDFWATEAMDDL